MKRKGVDFTSRQRAVLRRYRFLFNKRAFRQHLPDSIGYANINEDPDGIVEGVLYAIRDEHLDLLDRSERYPKHYDRAHIVVETDDGVQKCFAYQAQPDKLATGLVPSREYLDHILAAADLLSRQYYKALAQSPTYTDECLSRCLNPTQPG